MSLPFEIIIHRAHNFVAPENSIEGILEIRQLSKNLRIEVDICVTSDDIPILCHDMSLERLCGSQLLVSKIKYTDLPKRNDNVAFVQLEEVINKFPEQSLLLDLRTSFLPEFFLGSETIPNEDPTLAIRLLSRIREIIPDGTEDRYRFIVTNLDHRPIVRDFFPTFEVDLGELATRVNLSELSTSSIIDILGSENNRMYIRFRDIRPHIIQWAQAHGISIIANHSPSRRSLKNSLMMFEKCYGWGLSGLVASPVDERIITKLKL